MNHKYNADVVGNPKDYKPKFILKRLNDGLTQVGKFKVEYIEWNKDVYNCRHNDIKIGRSLLLDNGWMTTVITEIIEQRDKYIKFQTKNSTYELTEL
jgi:hypothetical protein